MKNTFKQLVTITFIMLLIIAINSCSSSKKATTSTPPPDEVEVVILCSGPEFSSNEKALRFSAIGTSMDQMTSKKKALSDARAGLAAQLETKVKSVIDNYTKSVGISNREDLTNRYEGLSREVVNQNLTGVRTICERMTKTKEGNFKTYICIELGGPEILNSLNNKISKDEVLKADYDYEKFKKNFDDEMAKMNNQ